MRILLLNQFYPPNEAATGQLMSDVAERLAEAGEDVTVVCGGGELNANSMETPGIHVVRVRSGAPVRGLLGRVFSYAGYYCRAAWKGLTGPSPDVVITLTTPPLLSLVGLAVQKLRGARHVIWEMDVYPDVAIALGVLRGGGVIAMVAGWLADYARHKADKVITLGECMQQRLLSHGIASDKLSVCENWAYADADSFAANWHQGDSLRVLYSGNLGMAHDVDTVADAMVDLDRNSGSSRIKFSFAGGGVRLRELKAACADLTNVEYRPYCRREDLGSRIAESDIGLVTQRDDSIGMVVPSKTYGILAAGRPILFVGPAEAEPSRIIERWQCGWRVACGDTDGLVTLLRTLAADRNLVREAGERAYEAFLAKYQRNLGTERVVEIVREPATSPVAEAVLTL